MTRYRIAGIFHFYAVDLLLAYMPGLWDVGPKEKCDCQLVVILLYTTKEKKSLGLAPLANQTNTISH